MKKNPNDRQSEVRLTAQNLEAIRQMIESAQTSLFQAKKMLFADMYTLQAAKVTAQTDKDSQIVEGVFDGENLVNARGKKYPVPANYASKSKLIPGDVLKLTIASDGTFIFKQIGPIERKKLIGILDEDNDKFQVLADGKRYNILTACVTYFHAKSGDKLTIIVPKEGESAWAAVENLIEGSS